MSSYNKEECFTITWRIENMSLLMLNKGIIRSPAWKTESTNENAKLYSDFYFSTDLGLIIEVQALVTQLEPDWCTMSLLTHSDEVPLERIHDNSTSSGDENAIPGDNRQSIIQNDTLTVCYKMWDKTLKAGELRTRSVVRKWNYLWDIKYFRPSSLYSNTIIAEGNVPFYMILNNSNHERYTHTLFLGGLQCGENSISLLNCNVSLKNGASSASSCDGNIWRGVFDIVTNSMTENLQLEIEYIFLVHMNYETDMNYEIDSPSALGTDLQHLYKDGLYSDVTIQTEGKSFSVHKNILAARSPVFRAMFENDEMREARSGVVDIKDVDSTTLDHMLAFLYCGSLTGVHWENVSSLYYAADKYAVLSLKEKCADILKAGLSVDNACDLLVLTDTHSDQELMEYVVNFILDHQEVVSSPRWMELEKSNSLLTLKILRKLFLSCKRKK